MKISVGNLEVMKLLISFVLLAFCSKLAFLQQCRQVTVCNDDMINRDVTKGDKGDVGIPGKAGNKGIKGEPGEIGRNGIQGESCSLGSFGDRLMEKLTRLEELLTVTTTAPTTTTSSTTTTTSAPALSSCADASSTNGVHTLQNGDEVLCENGWTVFQRRRDGSEDFEQTWDAYRTGFGQMTGEFWLGLDKIYRLTRSGNCRLKIELWDFDDVYKYANYNGFSVDDESNLFRLHIGSYSGTAGDALTYHNNRLFTARDRDNDANTGGNCADEYEGSGGWWYGNCRYSALNAVWGRSNSRGKIEWHQWKPTGGMETTKMMFRCD